MPGDRRPAPKLPEGALPQFVEGGLWALRQITKDSRTIASVREALEAEGRSIATAERSPRQPPASIAREAGLLLGYADAVEWGQYDPARLVDALRESAERIGDPTIGRAALEGRVSLKPEARRRMSDAERQRLRGALADYG